MFENAKLRRVSEHDICVIINTGEKKIERLKLEENIWPELNPTLFPFCHFENGRTSIPFFFFCLRR